MARAKGTSPAYLLYPNDILSSGRVAALKPLEELWYRRAIDLGWENEGMPADPVEFAGWVGRGCTASAAEKIIQKFFVVKKKDASKVVNPRQEIERTKLKRKSKQKSEAGKRGMANRWKHKASGDNSVITENNIPIPIPITKEKKESPTEIPKKTAPPAAARSRATRIPDPFPITPEMWAWIAENLNGLDNVTAAHADWVEYWTNETGSKAEKINWTLTWQKGMRLAKKWQDEAKQNGTFGKPSSEREKSAQRGANSRRFADELEREGRAERARQGLHGSSDANGAQVDIARQLTGSDRG